MEHLNTKYLVISSFKDADEKFSFRMSKHRRCKFFETYSKVIEFTIFHRFIVIEF